ncbi:DNA polymerase I [Bordetella phage CN1]|uniref:DNA-directed DNA polymerase n=1 Tax=Bordetella phage CN1 TaxID=1916123 RepID=A0A2D0W9P7_9CAUD|nr:DNA polymerase I [Bordetella phage CN1]APL99398.1 DNA polymerase I [Bordetella phage CN1]
MQFPLFTTVQSTWTPPDLNALPSWEGAKRVAIDCETRDPDLKKLGPGAGRRPNSYITGISFAIEDGPGGYLPIRHEGGDNLPVEAVLRYFRDQAKVFTGDIVGANLPYDLDFLAGDGIEFSRARFFRDIQIADPLICELHDSYSMQAIAQRWGFEGKNEAMLRAAAGDYKIDPKKDMWKLPARFVGAYAEEDTRLPLNILRRQEREIDDQDLWQVYDLESRLLPVLTKLRRRGVRIDTDRLEQIERWAYAKEAEALARVRAATGVKIAVGDVWKPEALAPALEYIGIRLNKTSTGKPSIDKELLGSIDHPVADALERARKVNKLRTTFAGSVRDHMVNGRIHCTFNQLRKQRDDEEGTAGAAYGRLSCQNPNLQQQPARDDFAPMWRAIYLPEEGELWASNDYSQQEPRMAVHYACLARDLIGQHAWQSAIAARDAYRNDPNTDNHQMMADMAGIKRKDAKEIYLGLSYGMGGAKMCRKLGLPTMMAVRGPRFQLFDVNSPEGKRLVEEGARRFEAAGPEGQRLLDTFDSKVPFVKKLAKACEARAKAVGYITTLSGRRCRFPKDRDGNFDWTHKGLNRLIQGSSADQTKAAMVALDAAGFDMIIQVHDEIAFSIRDPKEGEAAAEIMRTCVPLELPSKVDVEVGPTWGHSMGWNGELPE